MNWTTYIMSLQKIFIYTTRLTQGFPDLSWDVNNMAVCVEKSFTLAYKFSFSGICLLPILLASGIFIRSK